MRRYWFSIALVLFVAVSIGTYYVGAATRDLPDYRLRTIAGDPKEAANLAFDAAAKLGKTSDHLVIGSAGSSYDLKKSLIEQMIDSDFMKKNPDLAQLKTEHKGFMRGKLSYDGFYADENRLVYAASHRGTSQAPDGLASYTIAIETQDLKSGKIHRFDAILPGKPTYSSFYVNDVQALGNQLKIMVQLSKDSMEDRSGGSLMSEIHVYTVDLDKEGITDDRVIAADKKLAGGKAEHYQFLNAKLAIASRSDYALIGKSIVQRTEFSDGNWEEGTVETSCAAYNYSDAALTPVTVDVVGNGSDLLNSGKLLKFSMKGEQVHVGSFDIGKEQESASFDIPLSVKLSSLSSIQKFVYGDRLYLFNRVNSENELIIANIPSGKVAYQGKITVDGTAEQQKARMNALQIYDYYLAL